MLEWIDKNEAILWSLAAASLVTFIVSVLAVPHVVVSIRPEYFAQDRRPPSRWHNAHPVIRMLLQIGRNALGVVFILGGIAMLALPGQGLLTILVGVMLIDFPRKYQFEKWLLRRRPILRAINWLRRRRGRPPLQVNSSRGESRGSGVSGKSEHHQPRGTGLRRNPYHCELMTGPSRLFAWIDPEQETLLREVIERADLRLVALGSDDATAARELGGRLDATPIHDLRHGLENLAGQVDVVWLASRATLDQSTRRTVRQTGLRIITSEPRPDSPATLLKDPSLGELFTLVPLMTLSEGAFAARGMLSEFGPVHAVSIDMSAGDRTGSIRARLFDALCAVHWLCGEAVEISAARSDRDEGVQWLTANVVCEAGRSATVTIHRHTGPWARRIIAHGDQGLLEITDTTCRWVECDADFVGERVHRTTPAEQIAAQLRRMGSPRGRSEAPVEPVQLMALVEAALLSCRTRQVETPGRMVQALAGP